MRHYAKPLLGICKKCGYMAEYSIKVRIPRKKKKLAKKIQSKRTGQKLKDIRIEAVAPNLFIQVN